MRGFKMQQEPVVRESGVVAVRKKGLVKTKPNTLGHNRPFVKPFVGVSQPRF
jgi:hypothetical protein